MVFKPEHHPRPESVWHDEEELSLKMKELEGVFETTRPAFEDLVRQMREPIKKHRWGALLGEDRSGRLPALVLGFLLERAAQEEGVKSPKRFFLSGGYRGPERGNQLQEYLRTIRPDLGDRILLVTEHVSSGKTVLELGALFRKEGLEFDVAALSGSLEHNASQGSPQEKAILKGVRRYEVSDEVEKVNPGDAFYNKLSAKEATGVEKHMYPWEPIASRNYWADPELVEAARKKAHDLADELYEKYFVEKPEESAKAA